jgi:hypothetical protein
MHWNDVNDLEVHTLLAAGQHIPTTYLQELGSSSSSPRQLYPLLRLLILELSSDLRTFPYTLF